MIYKFDIQALVAMYILLVVHIAWAGRLGKYLLYITFSGERNEMTMQSCER